jgi:hypothetical protein
VPDVWSRGSGCEVYSTLLCVDLDGETLAFVPGTPMSTEVTLRYGLVTIDLPLGGRATVVAAGSAGPCQHLGALNCQVVTNNPLSPPDPTVGELVCVTVGSASVNADTDPEYEYIVPLALVRPC